MFARIASLVALGMAAAVHAEGFSPPPPLDPNQLPAVVYSQSEFGKENVDVYITYKEQDTWKRDTLMSAPFVALEQLEGPKFLLASGSSAQTSQLYLVDLAAGTSVQVTTRTGHCPIAFPRPHDRYFRWKEAQKAFLIQDGDHENDVEFITVNYADMTYETMKLAKSLFGPEFNDQTHLKIGPNGAHIAFAQPSGRPTNTPRTQEYVIKVYHFSDKQVTTVAPKVLVQLAEDAPGPIGWPPFEWYDWEAVIYGDTVPAASGKDAEITFLTTNVHKDDINPLFGQRMPLTAEGGEIFRESPLVPEIVYRAGGLSKEQYVIDKDALTLMAWKDPNTLSFSATNGAVQVETPTRLLYRGPSFAGQAYGIISPKKHLVAFALSTAPEVEDKDRKAELYVGLEQGDPQKVAGPVYYARPLAIIEK